MLIELLAATALMSAGGQEFAPQQDSQRVAPRGDYTRTCSGAYVNRGRLYADCRNDRGRIRGTSIALNQCSDYEIQNRDGLLVCGPHRGSYEDRPGNGGGNGGGWGGGNDGGWGGGNGRASITLYRDINYRGPARTYNGEVVDLRQLGFNDQASSFQLRGTWEVCTDSYFRGRCQVFDVNETSLVRWRMNDQISSMRPVGRGGGRW